YQKVPVFIDLRYGRFRKRGKRRKISRMGFSFEGENKRHYTGDEERVEMLKTRSGHSMWVTYMVEMKKQGLSVKRKKRSELEQSLMVYGFKGNSMKGVLAQPANVRKKTRSLNRTETPQNKDKGLLDDPTYDLAYETGKSTAKETEYKPESTWLFRQLDQGVNGGKGSK
ncbi:unnamed protein product, partial [Brassica rapa subsp. trilocularis]